LIKLQVLKVKRKVLLAERDHPTTDDDKLYDKYDKEFSEDQDRLRGIVNDILRTEIRTMTTNSQERAVIVS
jgi:hypothetical protein